MRLSRLALYLEAKAACVSETLNVVMWVLLVRLQSIYIKKVLIRIEKKSLNMRKTTFVICRSYLQSRMTNLYNML